MNTARVRYDPTEDILFIDTEGARVETRADIDALFEGILAEWRAICGGRKVYVVVGYDGFTINLRENDYYAERMSASVAQFAKAVVRYGGDTLTRSAARIRGLKLQTPSNLYESRTQALQVVRGLRSGRLSFSG